MEHFINTCRQHRLKVTPQRMAIYRALTSDHSHPSTEVIFRKVRQTCPSISFDTVNRTLLGFSRIGLIDTIECTGQGRKYESNKIPHHHVKCRLCGAIVDFMNPSFDRLSVPQTIRKKYQVTAKQVVLKGTCLTCQQKGGRGNGNQG